jgi:hypothetical protein
LSACAARFDVTAGPLAGTKISKILSALLLPIYGQLWPIPPWPYNLVPYLIVAWTLGGVAYFYYIRTRRTDMLDAMGRVWEPAPN